MLEPMSTPPSPAETARAGIPDSALAGPFPVGEYAAALQKKLRSMTRVQLVGELVNLRPSRARVYFELRDATGAIPCAAWRRDWEAMSARAGGPPAEGMQVVVAGGCDYYPGSATSSPGFSFAVTDLRVAGEGDLLARIERLRKQLDAEGLLERQKRLELPLLPRTIGVITGEGGKARDDVLAALRTAGLGGAPGVGLRARAGPPRGARDLKGAVRSAGRGGGGGRDRGPRRRLAGRPVVLLR